MESRIYADKLLVVCVHITKCCMTETIWTNEVDCSIFTNVGGKFYQHKKTTLCQEHKNITYRIKHPSLYGIFQWNCFFLKKKIWDKMVIELNRTEDKVEWNYS